MSSHPFAVDSWRREAVQRSATPAQVALAEAQRGTGDPCQCGHPRWAHACDAYWDGACIVGCACPSGYIPVSGVYDGTLGPPVIPRADGAGGT